MEPLIYDLSSPGRVGAVLPESDVPHTPLPEGLLRAALPLPEVSQIDVTRHFTRLSRLNMGIDTNMYPLGSCTMKYNPRINEDTARMAGFALAHPLQDPDVSQGAMYVLYQLQQFLAEIAGMAGCSLQPAAGAQGEFTGVLMMRAYHRARGDHKRTRMLIPDSAHGTNPATCTMAGLKVVELPSDSRGNIDLEALKANLDDTICGLMITNPNTLGMFEEHVEQVVQLVHAAGGLVYGDGANMNAMVGVCKPGEIGFDVLHYNLHKTFSTPHGGGGPGSGPVVVSKRMLDFLPGPIVIAADTEGDENAPLYEFFTPARSIGRMRAFYGNFGMHTRAYTYMRVHGEEGLRANTLNAVLNANYIQEKIKAVYPVPYGHERHCMHEVVAQGKIEGAPDIRALDIAKRLMDKDFHPPTNYFPLIVPEALMIEPTETESIQTIDAYIAAMLEIAREAVETPELLKTAPHNAPMRRMDEVKAARDLVLCCKPD
ncbi:MAG TPA: aminomethyl-transferring glycine dehydrogenase subunit GcvPB [Thermoflexales bacterium]|jgi:glycine dehydrogenase subunit 2|nr:aminomethyl-transferring glycine dehydrogenase subunit GcvPB [Thermoflexales bacterium]HQX09156.1 aminomethyl-transferring glycine dehydrogenase subunit GcvPB [Thermoflexales bacterium]HQY24304.1 aminomethyl-transferring glycine dehydrogenase subunit GcvPB [Thermoflexales bacterium]HQZ52729.1 aminomethyl-transferring glycine dehydrogenase subunit GcvPB [Thermoflexales bacterium]HRA52306.1 aminomethyl-transferring glycine dehydrogenase subunit GcvPB [Thermoflexales bacterium]